ncbi:MAG: T9SS type A sorting domain-containing protein, partial [Candidatus Oleimicrobiaceae bacterium]
HLPVTLFAAPSGIASRGRGQLPESPALRVYPNPARDAVTLTTALSPRSEARVTIHDLCGRTVRTLSRWADTAGTLQEVLELKDLPAGVYLVLVQTPHTRASTKLVKIR